ncbi:hypothetical protein MTR67_047739, partial [Solanum verrucosum]
MRDESQLRFENLTQGSLSVIKYEVHFCELSRHAMTIVLDEAKRVHTFVRGLTFSVRSYVFRATREGDSFQSIVSTAKEVEFMLLEEFGEPKKARSSVPPTKGRGRGQTGRGGRTTDRATPTPQGGGRGVPSDKDIDFAIDLDPGTKTISITPYHMVPVELKELKDQLQDLLSKGFIHPNVSSWGAPALFVRKNDGSMKISFLGHVVSKKGIRVDPTKIEAVKDCTRSPSVTEIWSLIGLAGKLLAWEVLLLLVWRRGHWLEIFRVEQIREHQFDEENLCFIRDKVMRREANEDVLDSDGILRIGGRICVPKMEHRDETCDGYDVEVCFVKWLRCQGLF